MLGVSYYDSRRLRNELLNTNIGKLLTPKNKRIFININLYIHFCNFCVFCLIHKNV